MKKIATTLLLTIGGVVAAQDSSDWINYTSPTGHYSVLMPSQPKLITQEGTTSSGDKAPQYVAIAQDSSGTYMTAYFDYPTATSSFSFDKARDGMLANVKGTLVSEKSIRLGGYSGREVKMSGKTDDGTKFIARVRFYDVNRRIYMVQYIGRKPNDTSAKTTRFLDSFKVVKP